MKKKTALFLALATFIAGVGVTVGAAAITREIHAHMHSDWEYKQNVISAKQNVSPTVTDAEFIGEERAKEIALEKAGLNASDVVFIKAELDRDNGRFVYEIDFRKDYTEYEAEINAVDGKILKFEKDYFD